MPIDHLGIVACGEDYQKTIDFYLKALEPIGYRKLLEPHPKAIGLGANEWAPDFWITDPPENIPRGFIHLAFTASDRESVKKCYDAAIAAGARGNGAPGLRPQYHPHYFGAFFFDPLGNNIEVVCHKAQ